MVSSHRHRGVIVYCGGGVRALRTTTLCSVLARRWYYLIANCSQPRVSRVPWSTRRCAHQQARARALGPASAAPALLT